MSEHFIKKCRICGVVISQCRCRSKDKVEYWDYCEKCKASYQQERASEAKANLTT